jgi:hypothetical protein
MKNGLQSLIYYLSRRKFPDADVYIRLHAGEKESYLWNIKRQADTYDNTRALDGFAVPVMLG